MAKYIILNGQRNYITLTRHLLLKIFIRHLEQDRAKNEPQSLQMPDYSFLFIILYQRYTESTEHKQYTCHNHHVALYRTNKR